MRKSVILPQRKKQNMEIAKRNQQRSHFLKAGFEESLLY